MRNGFTLIELIVVIFMIGILVAMSTGVVYFLLSQYPESLNNIGYVNKTYTDIANDLLLVQYADKISIDSDNRIKLYFWDTQDRRFYTKYLAQNPNANYVPNPTTRTVTVLFDSATYAAHSLHEPIPVPSSIQISGSQAIVNLLYPGIITGAQITPTGTLNCTNAVQIAGLSACTTFTVATSTVPYTVDKIQDINGKSYKYTLQTVQTPTLVEELPALPTFLKENPL